MPRLVCMLALCFALVLLPSRGFSQGPMTLPRSPADTPRIYDNSPDGLRWQLQDILNAARARNSARLESLIKQTEISDPEWFTRTFGADNGAGWAKEYKDDLAESEVDMEGLMTLLAEQDGEFWVRNIKYERAPAREMEGTLIDSLQRPVNIWCASWKARNSPPDASSAIIGYFVFIDGRFRWDSAVTPADVSFETNNSDQRIAPKIFPVQRSADAATAADGNSSPAYWPGVGGVGVPQCIDCQSAHYSKLALRNRLEGTVLLQITVQPDGTVSDPKVVKSPDGELSKMAIDGVTTWRFKPARRPDGEAVPARMMVEMNFRLVY